MIPMSSLHRKIHVGWALLVAVFVLGNIIFGTPSILAQDDSEVTFDFTFESNSEGWIAGFADLPVDHDKSTFELDSGHRPLPDGLEGGGIYIQGHNRSDDLFMFLKRKVGNLRPNAVYAVLVSVDLATNVPSGSFGIGGSPGESVYVKAGASTIEPNTVEGSDRHLRMNIDKGNQSIGGESMVVLGNVANPEVAGTEFRIKTLDNMDMPLNVETDNGGRAWLIVGTDSGFEGLSVFYYARIKYVLTIVEPPATTPVEPTVAPTVEPTVEPPVEPTVAPTVEPTATSLADPTSTPRAEPTPVPRDEGESTLPIWAIALIAVFAAALLCLALLTLRRRSRG